MSKPKKTDEDGSSNQPPQAGPDAERFVNDLLVRGEAVKPDSSGELPSDATHVITQQTPDGKVLEVKRARFKLV